MRQNYNLSLVSFQSPCFRSVSKFSYELDRRPWCGGVNIGVNSSAPDLGPFLESALLRLIFAHSFHLSSINALCGTI